MAAFRVSVFMCRMVIAYLKQDLQCLCCFTIFSVILFLMNFPLTLCDFLRPPLNLLTDHHRRPPKAGAENRKDLIARCEFLDEMCKKHLSPQSSLCLCNFPNNYMHERKEKEFSGGFCK